MYASIDLGTTGMQCILFNREGKILRTFYKEYPLIIKGRLIEQDANLWRETAKEALKVVAEGEKIKGISISSQGITLVPIDKAGNPLSNAISWLDKRAKKESDYLQEHFSKEETYEKLGRQFRESSTFSKIMWLKEHNNEIYKKTYKFLLPLDYLNYKFTQKCVTDYTMASGTGAFNIQKKEWDKDILKISKVDQSRLPEVKCMGTDLGPILPDIADEIGIPKSTHLFLGAQDQKCAAIGAGIAEGIYTISLGTATAISKISNCFNISNTDIPMQAFDDNRYIHEAVISTSGAGLKWLRDTLFEGKSYHELDEMVLNSPKGANGVSFIPNFTGSQGFISPEDFATIKGITLSTRKEDIVRALLEGVAIRIKELVELYKPPKELRLFGGGANSQVWCQIIADITKLKVVTLETSETASVGAAVLASSGEIKPPLIKKIYK